MKKNVPPFRFKKFECSHSQSSMRIGIDAVVLGGWADVEGVHSVLEVGCGCGVISMQIAERICDNSNNFAITAIDIDAASVEEASANFANCPWGENLEAKRADFLELKAPEPSKGSSKPGITAFNPDNKPSEDEQFYDLIISNPPYFESGVVNPDTARLVARHQGHLSPATLVRHAAGLQAEGGRVALVLPLDRAEATIEAAKDAGYQLRRRTDFRGHPAAPWKRSLLEFIKQAAPDIACLSEHLTLESTPGVPTEEHQSLCRRFYLKW